MDDKNFFDKETLKAISSETRSEILNLLNHKNYTLSDISDKLANATEQERMDFKISPSGYGIHWRLLDEDLSINGLLKQFEEKQLILG